MIEEKLLVEKYRPKVLNDIILPSRIINPIKDMIEKGDIPNLTFYGPAGCGKTSLAKIIIKELNADFIEINGSLDTSIDIIRYKVEKFASRASLVGNPVKICFVNEADGLSSAAQNALKNIIEKYSKTVRFIFDTNYKDKIVSPLLSRTGGGISFSFSDKEKLKMIKIYFQSLLKILDKENIAYDKKEIGILVKNYFPDMRNILMVIQSSIINNEVVLKNESEMIKYNELISSMKSKSFPLIRKSVQEISNYDNAIIHLYNIIDKFIDTKSIPDCIIILSEYAYQTNISISKEINFLSLVIEIMKQCKMKEI